ncbi:MAG: FGGY-family carbohydrate kinase [Candidatus Hodarchaeota archaeon]
MIKIGDYILSLDAGTTASKISLFDTQGKIIAISTREYTLLTPTALEVELPTEKFWEAFKLGTQDVLRQSKVDPKDIKAFSLSAQGETLILIDKEGKPLRNAISWMDNRAQKEAEILSQQFSNEEVYKITGQVSIVPTWPASKLLWIKKNEPNIFSKIYKILLVEDYLIWRLTKQFTCEGSLICSTVYWNITTEKWWNEMIDFLGISLDQLPEIKHSGEAVGNISEESAKDLGLSTNVMVSMGALDQACGTIGVGNVKPGIFTENTGAALAICATQDRSTPTFDTLRRMPVHYHGIPKRYMFHTFTTGGMVLRWYRDKFCKEEMNLAKQKGVDAYDIIAEMVEKVPAGSDGLVMLPHLQGAMAPEDNPKAKGVFYGFTLKHDKGHYARAIMEAIAFTVRRNLDIIEDLKINVNEIRVLGGGARSDVWNQIKADVTGKTLARTVNEEAACLGAAILAGKGAGIYSRIEDAASQMVSIKKKYFPNESNVDVYNKVYQKYIKLYEDLRDLFSLEKT